MLFLVQNKDEKILTSFILCLYILSLMLKIFVPNDINIISKY